MCLALTYSNFCQYFYVTKKYFKVEFFSSLLRIIILITIPLIFYGFLQHTGNDFVLWNNPYNSIILTFGNPNFASAFMAILSVFLLSSIHIGEMKTRLKIIIIVSFLLLFTLIVLSNSRQGLIAFFIGYGFFVIFRIRQSNKLLGLFFVSSFIVVVITGILGMLQVGPLKDLLYKPSLSVRGHYWRAALNMFVDKPLTGIGIERYGAYFKEYRELEYSLNYGFEITSTNAHNVFLQMFATGGLFVGLFYLLLVLYVFYKGFTSLSEHAGNVDNRNHNALLCVFSSWIAFQSQSVISIDNIGLTIWGWILGGMVLALASSNVEIEAKRKKDNLNSGLINIIYSWVLSFIMIILVSILYRGEVAPMQTAARFNGINPETKNLVYEYANNAIKTPMLDPNYKNYIVQLFIFHKDFQSAQKYSSELLNFDPRNQDYLLTAVYLAEEVKDFESALEYRKKIFTHDPFNASNLLEIARNYVRLGDRESAKIFYNNVISFASSTKEGELAYSELSDLK